MSSAMRRKIMIEKSSVRRDQGEMTASEMSMRKFLKQLGVTAHQELKAAIARAVAEGKLAPGSSIDITADLTVTELGMSHSVSAQVIAPEGED
tara:strand:- start:165 stop:443 length:279 start_codon:yes stop_codon:yes gene_type:complete